MDNPEHFGLAMEAQFELHQQVKETTYVSLYREDASRKRNLNVVFAGREKCREHYNFQRNEFPVYVLEYVLSGRGDLSLDSERFKIKKGSCFVYGPSIPCSIVTSEIDPLEKSFIAFQVPEGTFPEIFPLKTHFIESAHSIFGLEDILGQLFKSAFSSTEYSNNISRRYLEILFLKWLEHAKESRLAHKNSRSMFLNAKQLIDDNFLDYKKVDDIAQDSQLSPSYISRLFRQYFYMTPYNYLLKKKMEYALDLLSNSELSVAETATRTGFEDPFHFSRVFKMIMNKPPSAFKNRQ